MRLIARKLNGKKGHDVGRELLAELYREETGEELPPIAIGEWGKPYFPESRWHFSISHTRNYVFCVLAEENVAVDAEELDRPVRMQLVEKVLSESEKAQFDAAEDKNRAFLTFWVLKEAEAKLSGRGLRLYPNHTHFSLDDPRVAEIDGCLVAVMTEKASPSGEVGRC